MENYQKCCVNTDTSTYPVAMAYVPWQHWGMTYEPEKGLECGTIFPELDKPFLGVRGGCR